MTDLFFEASRDLEAERLAERYALAKVAVADLWPFLALAESVDEFDHRVALAHEHIAGKLDEDDRDLLSVTLTALRDDFADVLALRHETARTAPAAEPATLLQAGQQFWHGGQQRWITVQAAGDLPHQPDTRDNPYGQGANYFENAAEEGPNTGQTGTYPQFPAGPDPVDPLNGIFPMQPSTWATPPNATWVERPMNLQPGKRGSRPGVSNLDHMPMAQSAGGQTTVLAARVAAWALAGAGYVGEGVQNGPGQNPGYFAGGTEGIGGDPQNGYPEDLAVEDPDSRLNELYGAVPPQQSSGSGQGGAQPYSNPSTARQAAVPDFRDATRHTAPGGGEHAPYRIEEGDGGSYVVNDKGERKNSEPKSKDEARQFQKALYKNVPGAAESAQKAAAFYDPSDSHVRVIAQGEMPDSSGAGSAPEPPQSMTPGGVGSIAQPPLPAGPSSMGGGDPADPSGADAASKMQMPMTGMAVDPLAFARLAADTIRQRPNDMNPSGVADEYDERTWEGGVNTRPRQPAEDRGINTPQTPRDPIPQASSTDTQRELSDDEERLRQASRERLIREEQWLRRTVLPPSQPSAAVMAVGV